MMMVMNMNMLTGLMMSLLMVMMIDRLAFRLPLSSKPSALQPTSAPVDLSSLAQQPACSAYPAPAPKTQHT